EQLVDRARERGPDHRAPVHPVRTLGEVVHLDCLLRGCESQWIRRPDALVGALRQREQIVCRIQGLLRTVAARGFNTSWSGIYSHGLSALEGRAVRMAGRRVGRNSELGLPPTPLPCR